MSLSCSRCDVIDDRFLKGETENFFSFFTLFGELKENMSTEDGGEVL